MLGESGGQEVEVSEQVFAVINRGSGADARAVIEQIQEGIMFSVAGEPAVRGGVELPKRADFQALPAAHRGGRARCGEGVSQMMSQGPAAHGGGVDPDAQAAVDFGGGEAIGRGRLGGEQFAQEGFGTVGPDRRVVPAGNARRPTVLVVMRGGTEIIGIQFVEASATQAEFIRGGAGRDLVAAESSQDFADQGRAEAVGKLAVMLFIARRMDERREPDERGTLALRAFRRPPLRSGLLQARRAKSVRLCSHTCPGLLAHCSPLLATRHEL